MLWRARTVQEKLTTNSNNNKTIEIFFFLKVFPYFVPLVPQWVKFDLKFGFLVTNFHISSSIAKVTKNRKKE